MESADLVSAAERVESLKAGLVAGGVGTLVEASLLGLHRGMALGWDQALLSLVTGLGGSTFGLSCAIAGLSGFLFGATYRYAIRRDDNPHLKQGVVLAFALVRSLAQVDAASALAQHFGPLVAAGVESLVLFAIAGAVLDWCLRRGWVSPFPSA